MAMCKRYITHKQLCFSSAVYFIQSRMCHISENASKKNVQPKVTKCSIQTDTMSR